MYPYTDVLPNSIYVSTIINNLLINVSLSNSRHISSGLSFISIYHETPKWLSLLPTCHILDIASKCWCEDISIQVLKSIQHRHRALLLGSCLSQHPYCFDYCCVIHTTFNSILVSTNFNSIFNLLYYLVRFTLQQLLNCEFVTFFSCH